MADTDEIRANLRQLALRRAATAGAAASAAEETTFSSTSRVVLTVQAAPNKDCPMHGKNGSFHMPERRSSGAGTKDHARDYHSLPRRMSSNKASAPRDVFRGKLDFKTILRRFDPKDEERSSGGGRSGGGFRHESEPPPVRPLSPPPQYQSSRRGSIVDSDFDFRGGASREPNWDNPGRFRHNSLKRPRRPPHPPLDITIPQQQLRRSESNPTSPPPSRPLSPRRVGFTDLSPRELSPRELSPRELSPQELSPRESKGHARPILRHTTSDPHQQHRFFSPLTISHTNEDLGGDRYCAHLASDSLVQIYVPPQECDAERPRRAVPPPLAECWNRSQSFPPPKDLKKNSAPESDEITRRHSLPAQASAEDKRKLSLVFYHTIAKPS